MTNEQNTEDRLKQRLEGLYDRLDRFGDLRERGYSVPLSDISDVKRLIGELERIMGK